VHVQMSVDIEAPPEKVWSYLVEPDKTIQWHTMLEKFEYTSEETGPGSTFYWEENVRGKDGGCDREPSSQARGSFIISSV